MRALCHSLRAAVLALIATLACPAARHAVAQELPGNIVASTDAATVADQRLVYMLVHQYQQLLNAGSTEAIVDLFTADAAIEWNDTPTFITRQQKIDGYNALFRIAKLYQLPLFMTPLMFTGPSPSFAHIIPSELRS
jgi:hypothetical protein